MTLQTIDAVTAKRLIDKGALLVDIREPDEHVREHVPGARNTPLSRLGSLPANAKAVVFHCRSGARTSGNADRLAACWSTPSAWPRCTPRSARQPSRSP
jgi:rhodanese-related sulfurtransferase